MNKVKFQCHNRRCRSEMGRPGYCDQCTKLRTEAFRRGREAYERQQSEKRIEEILEILP